MNSENNKNNKADTEEKNLSERDELKKRKLRNVTILIDDGSSMTLERSQFESKKTFLNKTKFYIKCLEKNLSKDQADTYSSAYANKLKYNVTYNQFVEDKINEILDNKGEESNEIEI